MLQHKTVYKNIPADMLEKKQWVFNCGTSKRPWSVSNGKLMPAKINDPETFLNIETIQGFKNGTGNGDDMDIRAVIALQEDYTCIDIDYINDNPRKQAFKNLIMQYIYDNNLSAYAEHSMSGNGVHFIFKGTFDSPNIGAGRIAEMFCRNHFITLTGNTCGLCDGNGDPLIKTPKENLEELYSIILKKSENMKGAISGGHKRTMTGTTGATLCPYNFNYDKDNKIISLKPSEDLNIEGERNPKLFSLCASLSAAGFDANDIRHIFIPLTNTTLPESEINTIHRSAIKYATALQQGNMKKIQGRIHDVQICKGKDEVRVIISDDVNSKYYKFTYNLSTDNANSKIARVIQLYLLMEHPKYEFNIIDLLKLQNMYVDFYIEETSENEKKKYPFCYCKKS